MGFYMNFFQNSDLWFVYFKLQNVYWLKGRREKKKKNFFCSECNTKIRFKFPKCVHVLKHAEDGNEAHAC